MHGEVNNPNIDRKQETSMRNEKRRKASFISSKRKERKRVQAIKRVKRDVARRRAGFFSFRFKSAPNNYRAKTNQAEIHVPACTVHEVTVCVIQPCLEFQKVGNEKKQKQPHKRMTCQAVKIRDVLNSH